MDRMFRFAALATLLASPLEWDCAARELQARSQTATSRADCERDFDPSTACHFSVANTHFQVTADGILSRLDGHGTAELRLPLRAKTRVDLVLFGQVDGDLVVIYEAGDGESGAGVVVKVASNNLRMKWVLNLPSFNISLGCIEGTTLYQAGMGFVAAVTPVSGRRRIDKSTVGRPLTQRISVALQA